MTVNTLIMAGLLAFIPTSTSPTSLPNLCDDVYLDAEGIPIHDNTGVTLSRYCEAAGHDAPTWEKPVCCSFDAAGSHCTVASSTGGCDAGQAQMWCDHGKRERDGSVTCYQPLPNACDFGNCVAPPPGIPLGDATPLCCFAGECYMVVLDEPCGGAFDICMAPFTNENGTIGCADGDN